MAVQVVNEEWNHGGSQGYLSESGVESLEVIGIALSASNSCLLPLLQVASFVCLFFTAIHFFHCSYSHTFDVVAYSRE
jgi:hypothetical protein